MKGAIWGRQRLHAECACRLYGCRLAFGCGAALGERGWPHGRAALPACPRAWLSDW
jgi:hypothetical protein